MRKFWLGSGWKMHKTISESLSYAKYIKNYTINNKPSLSLFIVPPFTSLYVVSKTLQGTSILVGAQNMHWEDSGPYTGEISPLMIKDCGAEIVELGHSERRTLFGETDLMVNKKVLSALRNGIRPLICVGDTFTEKNISKAESFVENQLKIALQNVPKEYGSLIMIAYEPSWAIGIDGTAANPDYVNHMLSFIKDTIHKIFDGQVAELIPTLYGGSVNLQNASRYAEKPNIDGLFVGRASLEVKNFIEIIKSVESILV
jgi:triosephosphate isomerase